MAMVTNVGVAVVSAGAADAFDWSSTTNNADAVGMPSIMVFASSSGIAIHAVARASAIMQFSAITVTDKVFVVTG